VTDPADGDRQRNIEPVPPAGPIPVISGLAVPARRKAFDALALEGRILAEKIELLFQPVHDLLRGRATTFFLTPAFCLEGSPVITGYAAFQQLARDDFPLVDRAMLAHGLKFARRLAQAGVHVTVGVPVAFETLISNEGRMFYRDSLRAAGVENRPSLVIRIDNLPVGVTASRIAELASLVRPLATQVFVHLPMADSKLSNCGLLGATGYVLKVSEGARPSLEDAAKWLARFCENQLALSCADQIGSDAELLAARRHSIRFGTGAALGPAWFRGDAAPAEVESFMRAAQRAARTEERNVYRLSTHRELKAARKFQ